MSLHDEIVNTIKKIPRGKVATYGQIAAIAGNPMAARQVVRALHTSSGKEKLPWHRVINKQGKISLPPGDGFEIQKGLLEKEKVVVSAAGKIDLKEYLWSPR